MKPPRPIRIRVTVADTRARERAEAATTGNVWGERDWHDDGMGFDVSSTSRDVVLNLHRLPGVRVFRL
jgi:hypothetical protein